MNPEEAVFETHYSLADYIKAAGWSSWPLIVSISGLIVLGIILLRRRPSPSVRWGYMMAASLPLFIGFTGTITGLMSAVFALGARGSSDNARFHGVMGEVIVPLAMGLFGAAIAMTLACFVWMRRGKPAGQ